MVFPDYNGGSILNLMCSLQKHFGIRPRYPLLWKQPGFGRRVVLVVLDGLGYNFLRKNAPGGFFDRHCFSRLTTVFPATTAAALATFRTALAPSHHGILGWYMYYRELGMVAKPLRWKSREGSEICTEAGQVLPRPFFDRNSSIVMPAELARTDFSLALKGGAGLHAYSTLLGCFRQILRQKARFVYAYYPYFDSLCHEKGPLHRDAVQGIRMLDSAFAWLGERLDATLIVTSDHGFMQTSRSEVTWIQDHPALSESLVLPLCGEPRAAYCYVRMGMQRQFLAEARKLGCTVHKSTDFISKGVFGPRPKRFVFERTGDYILVPPGNRIIRDRLLSEEKGFNLGNHGGLSSDEMHVPLIISQKI